MKTYFNDAIIGNKNLKVALTDNGEIVRIRYPNVDYREFIEFLHMGVKVNDSNIIYLHNDPNNVYKQEYIEDTNILKTQIKNTYFNLVMEQVDFVSISKNIIVRKYIFSNEHEIPLDMKFLVHSKVLSNENDFSGAKIIDNGILQYSHDYNMTIISNDLNLISHKINGTDEVIQSGILYDKDYIGMSSNCAVTYDVGMLNPHEKKEFSLLIFISDNKEKNEIKDIQKKIEDIKDFDYKKELQNVKAYWKMYLIGHTPYELRDGTQYRERIDKIYKRTALLLPILTNSVTGGISAAMEVDENFSKCR